MLKILILPLDLVKLIEETVRSENARTPNSPIYLIGESFGGCLALAVAARNPQIDIVLILENPGGTKIFTQIAYLVEACTIKLRGHSANFFLCSYMFREVSAAASVVIT